MKFESISITDGEIKIGAENWEPLRKKPVLAVTKGNCATKYASFNSEKAAEEFMNILCDFFRIERRKKNDY